MPKNIAVVDIKPKMRAVVNTKPANNKVFGETVIYTASAILLKGTWIPLVGLTYPANINIIQPRP